MVTGALDKPVDELALELAGKIGARIKTSGRALIAQDDVAPDPLPALKEELAGRQRPVVVVVVREEHVAARRAPVLDPAVETEIKRLPADCGFTVKDVPANALADWIKALGKDQAPAWPQALAGVDVVVTGEAFSEFAARIGNLNSCSARAEINVVQRSDGRIVFSDAAMARAVDLSENLAGKKALQATGRNLGLKLLQHFVNTLPAQR